MKAENLHVDFYIDYEKKRVHLLEKGNPIYTDSLPNKIGTEFQKTFIEQGNLSEDIINFEWVCYCSNGLVLLFKDRNLSLTHNKAEWLYKPFWKVIKPK